MELIKLWATEENLSSKWPNVDGKLVCQQLVTGNCSKMTAEGEVTEER